MGDGGGADLYTALAPIYDDWQSSDGMQPFALVAADKLAPLLEREARGRATAGAEFSFADLGCGTGTLLGELRRRQPIWRLTGLDANAAMLAAAARKSTAGTIGLGRVSLEGPLPFLRAFDAAGVFYDTFNHLPDAAALARALAAIATALRPGGLLVFDLTNRKGFERWWRGQSDFQGLDWRISINARFEATSDIGLAEVTISRQGRGGPTPSFRLQERHLPEREVAEALAKAGFTVERTEGWAPFSHDIEGKTWWLARLSGKRQ
jgi:SAM-dependent methyltransferase